MNHQHPELCWHDVEPFAGVLPDAMQRVAAARARVGIDIDHHLDPRQVRRKRSAVQATLGRPACPLGRIGRINLGLITCGSLLDIFEPEQHLIFGQCLGTPTKALTLQFFDDLTQPIVLRPLRNQHRLERARVVRKCIRRHGGSRSCVALRHERFQPADSLCRNHMQAASAPASPALREPASNQALPTRPRALQPTTVLVEQSDFRCGDGQASMRWSLHPRFAKGPTAIDEAALVIFVRELEYVAGHPHSHTL